MALFKDGKPDLREAITLVGEEAHFHGILTVKGSLRVEGCVEGDIMDAISVEVGKKGRIKGNVSAEFISIAGEIEGDVVCSRALEILSKGRLTGDLRTPKLRVEDGAFFEGRCTMTGPQDRFPIPEESSQEQAPQ